MINSPDNAHQAAQFINSKLSHFKPKLGIILGSGLGGFADLLEKPYSISYEYLAGFPQPTVHGHQGNIVMGYLNGVSVICLQGRAHVYEGGHFDAVRTYVRTLRLLGCDYFIATNAAGSLCAEIGPGELMLITDHINLQPGNPLIGPNDDNFGPRFPPLDNAYDKALRSQLLGIANDVGITLHQGVYLAVSGPSYETAAEIRAFRILGADVVGMSTVPEVLVANHCGMKVAVLSTITNYATGLAVTSHDHNQVVNVAASATKKLQHLIQEWVKKLA